MTTCATNEKAKNNKRRHSPQQHPIHVQQPTHQNAGSSTWENLASWYSPAEIDDLTQELLQVQEEEKSRSVQRSWEQATHLNKESSTTRQRGIEFDLSLIEGNVDSTTPINANTRQTSNNKRIKANKKQRIYHHRGLRTVSKYRYELVFDELIFSFNEHDPNQLACKIIRLGKPDIMVASYYWTSSSIFEAHHSFSTTLKQTPQHCIPTAQSTDKPDPLGLGTYQEVTGLQEDAMKTILQEVFDRMPDGLMVLRENVQVIDSDDGIVRSIAPVVLIGTAIIHTSLKDLHTCMPFIATQHPMLHNTVSDQPTLIGNVLNGMTSMLSNIPISITVDVSVELEGYLMVYFDKKTNDAFRIEYHYFRAKTIPFATNS